MNSKEKERKEEPNALPHSSRTVLQLRKEEPHALALHAFNDISQN